MKVGAWIAAGAVAGAIALGLAACGERDDDDGVATPPVSSATATATPRADVTPAATATAGGDEPVEATPGGGGQAATPAATPTIAAGMRTVRAPIDERELIVRESFPPQYAVRIVSGLPDGCHAFHSATLTRKGDDMHIEVLNVVPTATDIACTQVYGQHESIVELGTDFRSGVEYEVTINDEGLRFVAQ